MKIMKYELPASTNIVTTLVMNYEAHGSTGSTIAGTYYYLTVS